MKFIIMGVLTSMILSEIGLNGWRFWLAVVWCFVIAAVVNEAARRRGEADYDDAYQRGWKASEKYFEMRQKLYAPHIPKYGTWDYRRSDEQPRHDKGAGE